MVRDEFIKAKALLIKRKIEHLKTLAAVSDRMVALTERTGKSALRAMDSLMEERKKIVSAIDAIDIEIRNQAGQARNENAIGTGGPDQSEIHEAEGQIASILEHVKGNDALLFSFLKDKREQIKKELLTLQAAKKSIPAYLKVPRKKGNIVNKTDK
jgi:hypothetical protein